MVIKKSWKEFQETGLFLIINQILHIFGWALVYEIEDGEIKNVYPARVKYRGFDNKNVQEAHKKVAGYLKENIEELEEEANQ
jgi:hypothetical protein